MVVVPDGPPLRRWREWTTFRFEIDSGDTIDVGLDGEALRLEPPLRFESLPAALRIRTPAGRRHPAPPPLRRKGALVAIVGAFQALVALVLPADREPRAQHSFIKEGGVLGRPPFSAASARTSSTARLSVLRNNVSRRSTRDVLRPAGNGRWWSDRAPWATGRRPGAEDATPCKLCPG